MNISCNNLSASYGQKPVLKNISLEINTGDFICLCGKNGSGKSTLLKILSGSEKMESKSLHPTTGTVSPVFKSPAQTARFLSYLPQSENPAWNCKVIDLLLQGRFCWTGGIYSQEDYDIAEEAAKTIRIEGLLERDIFSLSGGEFQKARIARCLAQKTSFLLLDEPCAALDFTAEDELLFTLKELTQRQDNPLGVVLTIHNVNNAARFAKTLALLPVNQPLILGSPDQVLTEQNATQVFQKEIKVFNHPVYNCPQVL